MRSANRPPEPLPRRAADDRATTTSTVEPQRPQQVETEHELTRRYLASGMSEADWERDKRRLREAHHRALATDPAEDSDDAVRRALSAAMLAVF